jgi:hypothetical protein
MIQYKKLKNNSFSFQLDESTDSTKKKFVLAFVRFVNDGEIKEKFVCCKQLSETSKGQDKFNVCVFISGNKWSILGDFCPRKPGGTEMKWDTSAAGLYR